MNLRNLAIWAVIIIALVGLISIFNPAGKGSTQQEVTYSQLMNRIGAGQVKSCTLRGTTAECAANDGKTLTAYTSAEALQKVLDMGVEEGATLAINQIDGVLAG